MTTRVWRLRAFAVSVLAALPLLAQADASPVILTAQTSLSNVQIKLIDLNPNDGIAPGVTFNSVIRLDPNAWNVDGDGNWTYNGPLFNNTLTPDGSASLPLNAGMTQVSTAPGSVSISNQVTWDQFNAYANTYGSLTTSHTYLSANVTLEPSSASDLSASFTVTPNTLLVITGTAKSSWSLDASQVSALLGPQYNSWSMSTYINSSAGVMLSSDSTVLSSNGASAGYESSSMGGANVGLSLNPWDVQGGGLIVSGDTNLTFSDSVTKDFQFNFANSTDQSKTGTAGMSVQTDLSSGLQAYLTYVPPVDPDPGIPGIPEPGTYALMGLGLVGVALARRRQQRQG